MKRIPSLDGLRAIAISLVVLGHWAEVGYQSPIAGAYASLGRRIFFVLSGYLITTLMMREYRKISTIRLEASTCGERIGSCPQPSRSWPRCSWSSGRDLRWYHMVAAAFYVAYFDFTHPWFLGHLWSISVQDQFYLLWPSVLKKWFRYRTINSPRSHRICASVPNRVPLRRFTWTGRRDIPGGEPTSRDWLPHGDFRDSTAEVRVRWAAADHLSRRFCTHTHGRTAISYHATAACLLVAGAFMFRLRDCSCTRFRSPTGY